MSKPQRIQLSRRKGFNLQAKSQALNGLPAMGVCRPSKWGNPFVVGKDGDAAECVRKFRARFEKSPFFKDSCRPFLRGYNLACFCRLDRPCHADVLLEWANKEGGA